MTKRKAAPRQIGIVDASRSTDLPSVSDEDLEYVLKTCQANGKGCLVCRRVRAEVKRRATEPAKPKRQP